jgi:hypothetical protein
VYGGGPELLVGKHDPGLHCHVTPELVKSSATFAVRVNCPFVCTAFEDPVTATLIGGGGSRLNEMFAVRFGLATDAATIATGNVVPPDGIEAGALYVAVQLVVYAGGVPEAAQLLEVTVPHAADEHDGALQVTPEPVTSQFTVAVRVAVLPAGTVAGAIAPATAIGLIAMVEAIETDDESFDVAVTVTEPPDGIAAGAVNVVGVELAVVTGLNDPHDAPPQDADHFTPSAFGSFATVTAKS